MTGNPSGPMNLAENPLPRSHAHGRRHLLPDKVDYDFIIDNDDELESFVAELRVRWIEEAADEAHVLRTVFSDRLPEVP